MHGLDTAIKTINFSQFFLYFGIWSCIVGTRIILSTKTFSMRSIDNNHTISNDAIHVLAFNFHLRIKRRIEKIKKKVEVLKPKDMATSPKRLISLTRLRQTFDFKNHLSFISHAETCVFA